MYNLMKMDMRRMWRSRYTWLILLIVLTMVFFSFFMVKASLDQIAETPDAQHSESISFTMDSPPEEFLEQLTVGSLGGSLIADGLIMIFCTIFVAFFLGAEQKDGYIKNIAGQLPVRGLLVVSKFITIALYLLILMGVHTVSVYLFGKIFFAEKMMVGSLSTLFSMLSAQYVLHLAFCGFLMLLHALSRSTAATLAGGLLVSVGLTRFIYTLINKLILVVNSTSEFDLGRYMVDSNIIAARFEATPQLFEQALIVGAVFVIVYVVLSALTVQKKDVC